jgi:hypothetical protein
MHMQESFTAQAGTPVVVTAPRHASLVPPRTPKDTSTLAAPAKAVEAREPQGDSTPPPPPPAAASPAPRYASLVPPRTPRTQPPPLTSATEPSVGDATLTQEQQAAAATVAETERATPPRYASLVPPRAPKTPSAPATAGVSTRMLGLSIVRVGVVRASVCVCIEVERWRVGGREALAHALACVACNRCVWPCVESWR